MSERVAQVCQATDAHHLRAAICSSFGSLQLTERRIINAQGNVETFQDVVGKPGSYTATCRAVPQIGFYFLGTRM